MSGLRIGIAGPVSLDLLDWSERPSTVPVGYPAPIIASLANGLMSRGHSVVVYTTSGGIARPLVLGDERLLVCIAPRSGPRSAATFFAPERRELRSLMRSHPAAVLHAQWTYEFAWAAFESGVPTLVTVRDVPLTVLRHSPDAYRALRAVMHGRTVRRARALTAVSPALRDALPRGPRAAAVVVPNFVPDALLASPAAAAAGARILVVANGFGRLKNVTTALRAFGLLRAAVPAASLRLVGDGMGPGGPAEDWARERGLGDGVTFVGRLAHAETLEEMRGAALLLHPSLYESFGMVVLEAMAVGLPVVGTERSGNVPALLAEGGGVACDVADPRALAEALERLLRDPAAIASRGDAARAAATRYSESRSLDAYEAAYRSLLGRLGEDGT